MDSLLLDNWISLDLFSFSCFCLLCFLETKVMKVGKTYLVYVVFILVWKRVFEVRKQVVLFFKYFHIVIIFLRKNFTGQFKNIILMFLEKWVASQNNQKQFTKIFHHSILLFSFSQINTKKLIRQIIFRTCFGKILHATQLSKNTKKMVLKPTK